MKPKYSLFTFLPAILVVVLTLALYSYFKKQENLDIENTFRELGKDYVHRLDVAVDHFFDLLGALKGFYDSSHEVARDEFSEFASRIKEPDDGIQAFEWVPRVSAGDRSRYEAAIRSAGHDGFVFTERDASGRLVPAAGRPEYFPVYFVEPSAGNKRALGFDLASDSARRTAMDKARDTGQASATAPVRLVQESRDSLGVLLFAPIYAKGSEISSPEDRNRNIRGFVSGVLRIDEVVKYAEQGVEEGKIAVWIEDEAAPDGQRLVYRDKAYDGLSAAAGTGNVQETTTISIADRSWRIVLAPTPKFYDTQRSRVTQVVLVSGFMIAVLVQVLFLSMRRRTAEIEQIVADQTTELREEKDFSETIINALPAIFYLIDKNGRFVRWNRTLEEVTGYSADEIARMHPLDFFEEENKSYIASKITEVFETGESFAEANLFTKSGGKIPYLFTGTRLVTAYGEFLTGMGVDISERKMAEEERTRLQMQLQQAQKMEAIGQLTGGIAHDFNNILSSILGYTELALERYVPDKEGQLAHYLKQVHGAGSRARDMVANMLAFSRGQRVKAEPLEVQPLVKEAVMMLRSVLPSTIQLVSRVDENLPNAVIDPVQLHQIILNLCINARDAIGGQGNIEVLLSKKSVSAVCSSCHKTATGDYLELVVSDTGSGIPVDVLPKIFDPFFSTKEVGKGSGMGLAVVHGIVHEHDGHILVDSSPGSGTTFRLLFPCVTPAKLPVDRQQDGSDEIARGNGRIMVVDDEEMVARMTSELLKVNGYTTIAFTDSHEALEWLRSSPSGIDAIVTDQTMPGITGTELAQAALAMRRDLPIILCTGYSDTVDAESAKKIGIRFFFLKPVAMGDLLSALKESMTAKKQ